MMKSTPFISRLQKIASNTLLTGYYQNLAKELEISDPKHPDQIYKTYLEDKKGSSHIDSAKGNLANTYVNAFVNMASGKDSLMLQRKEGDTAWIYKVKNEGLIAATASLGLIF
jgi:26S proteasome regulatory subunit N1